MEAQHQQQMLVRDLSWQDRSQAQREAREDLAGMGARACALCCCAGMVTQMPRKEEEEL